MRGSTDSPIEIGFESATEYALTWQKLFCQYTRGPHYIERLIATSGIFDVFSDEL